MDDIEVTGIVPRVVPIYFLLKSEFNLFSYICCGYLMLPPHFLVLWITIPGIVALKPGKAACTYLHIINICPT